MKAIAIFCLVFFSFSQPCKAYSDSTVHLKDFNNLIGCWQGNLTYLDYTSGKPFSMPANITVTNFKKTGHIVYSTSYPKEPNANSVDTLFISENGKRLNNEPVISKTNFNKDSLQVITEENAVDGNDHKPALIRHTYTLSRNSYSVKKEVLFMGEKQWILRNEYTFKRAKPCL